MSGPCPPSWNIPQKKQEWGGFDNGINRSDDHSASMNRALLRHKRDIIKHKWSAKCAPCMAFERTYSIVISHVKLNTINNFIDQKVKSCTTGFCKSSGRHRNWPHQSPRRTVALQNDPPIRGLSNCDDFKHAHADENNAIKCRKPWDVSWTVLSSLQIGSKWWLEWPCEVKYSNGCTHEFVPSTDPCYVTICLTCWWNCYICPFCKLRLKWQHLLSFYDSICSLSTYVISLQWSPFSSRSLDARLG